MNRDLVQGHAGLKRPGFDRHARKAGLFAIVAFLVLSTPANAAFGVVAKWGAYGSALGQFNNPQGVAVDAAGNVYVADSGNHRIQKFSPTGTHLTNWGSQGTGDGEFDHPSGIAVDGSGNVFVADALNDRVQKFTANGEFLGKWGSAGTGPGQFQRPKAITTDSAGFVYVIETGHAPSFEGGDRIQKFDSNGNFIATWASSGTGPGQLLDPGGTSVDGNRLYVADAGNDRIQVFDLTGSLVATWGTSGDDPGQLDFPFGITSDVAGNLLIIDLSSRVQRFSPDGAFLGSFGCPGHKSGQLNNPRAIVADSSDNVYVAESAPSVPHLSSGFAQIQRFGDPGTAIHCGELDVDARKKQKVRRLRVSVRCPAAACEVTIAGRAKARPRKVKLGTEEVSLEAGEKARIPLAPAGKAAKRKLKRALENRGKGKSVVDVTSLDVTNNSANANVAIKLKG
jgi:DNA-binding beta-propeller fold protein YncE